MPESPLKAACAAPGAPQALPLLHTRPSSPTAGRRARSSSAPPAFHMRLSLCLCLCCLLRLTPSLRCSLSHIHLNHRCALPSGLQLAEARREFCVCQVETLAGVVHKPHECKLINADCWIMPMPCAELLELSRPSRVRLTTRGASQAPEIPCAQPTVAALVERAEEAAGQLQALEGALALRGKGGRRLEVWGAGGGPGLQLRPGFWSLHAPAAVLHVDLALHVLHVVLSDGVDLAQVDIDVAEAGPRVETHSLWQGCEAEVHKVATLLRQRDAPLHEAVAVAPAAALGHDRQLGDGDGLHLGLELIRDEAKEAFPRIVASILRGGVLRANQQGQLPLAPARNAL
mmetsp:Transcript_97171/g.303055  ORF Transcript_97171/g.303055 Transcript_97171/m.303055 type:complete len:344 (+) Transcript_97171:122-1153(+)